jgi:hypothetical protein
VYRIGVLSIVLTLAAGQNVGLLCHVWCVPHEAATTECQHRDASPTVAGDESCERTVGAVVALGREDLRRGSPVPDGHHGVILSGSRFAPSPSEVGFTHVRAHVPLGARPLVIALRI